MFDLLQTHINKRVNLSPEEFDRICPFFIPRKFRKHQYLLQQDDICNHLVFVNDGCLREYSVDHKGEEHILQFAVADWWIADMNSFLSGKPSQQCIDAVEDSNVLMLERDARDAMFDAVPKMERFFRVLLEKKYVAIHDRLKDSLSESAEERYLRFMDVYPSLAQHVPQHYIASYLGITPQSLSRIRKELSQKS